MRANPTETLQAWGLKQPESSQDFSAVVTGVVGAQELLGHVASQSESIGRDLYLILAKTNILNLIPQQLDQLSEMSDEASAIEYLRNLFGEPQDGVEGALNVYMELASDQVNWQLQAKSQAETVKEQLHAKAEEVLFFMHQIVMAQLAEVQAEIEAREAILAEAVTTTSEHSSELQPLLTEKRQPLDSKLGMLRKEQAELKMTMSNVNEIMKGMTQGVEYRISPLLQTKVGPTELNPELAA